jgi:hypothetical protein
MWASCSLNSLTSMLEWSVTMTLYASLPLYGAAALIPWVATLRSLVSNSFTNFYLHMHYICPFRGIDHHSCKTSNSCIIPHTRQQLSYFLVFDVFSDVSSSLH